MILDFQHLLNTLNRVNHWLVLITFFQHTDPLLPHYRSEEFTFPPLALALTPLFFPDRSRASLPFFSLSRSHHENRHERPRHERGHPK